MSDRFVDTKWGNTVRVRETFAPDYESIALEIIGPRGGRGGYVVMDTTQARALATALHLALAELDIERGWAAA